MKGYIKLTSIDTTNTGEIPEYSIWVNPRHIGIVRPYMKDKTIMTVQGQKIMVKESPGMIQDKIDRLTDRA